ncbi:MAG: thiamine pyrophosphate-binding protein [Alphaproteobacteria bacterium]|nr:thiamine pyrophosphate-binding protein [Alphaproteobacteria bacterium]
MPDTPSAPNAISGRSAFLALLREEGVTHLFGNPGTTELPIMHALSTQPDLRYVLGLQESVVIAMADGFARASGQLVSVNLHVAPGLGNAIGVLYTAHVSGTPMIVTAGQQEQGHGLTEPLLYAPLVPIAQPVTKWAVEVNRIEDLPRIVHRAAKVALTPPTGPVFISLPGDILNAHAALDLGRSTRVAAATRPSDATLDALASALLSARNPVIVAGHEIATSDAFVEAARFAEALGAPVWQQTVPHGAHFPSRHPAFMGGLSRSQPRVRDLLSRHDLLIAVGADVLKMSVWSEVDPLPPAMRVVQIGQRDWELGKNYAAELAVRADVKETLAALIPMLTAQGGAAGAAAARDRLKTLAADNWSARRGPRAAQATQGESAGRVDPEWLMWRIAEQLPEDAIVVDEGITSSGSLLAFYPYRDRKSYFGNVSGGIGWGLAAAVGVQLAEPKRRVVAVIGDGSAQYSIQALWTAAHCGAPVVFIIANNGGYQILKERLKLFHGNDRPIGMDFQDPPIDCAQIARGYGLRAERIEAPNQFDAAFQAALAAAEPTVLEVMVQPRA